MDGYFRQWFFSKILDFFFAEIVSNLIKNYKQTAFLPSVMKTVRYKLLSAQGMSAKVAANGIRTYVGASLGSNPIRSHSAHPTLSNNLLFFPLFVKLNSKSHNYAVVTCSNCQLFQQLTFLQNGNTAQVRIRNR